MWKDFFNFTKRERISITVLILAIVVIQVLLFTSDKWVVYLPGYLQNRYNKEQALRSYIDSVTRIKTNSENVSRASSVAKSQAVMSEFDPNTADSTQLLRLGLKSWMVKNILKYRNKGGQFRNSADFSKVYGLDSSLFKRLEPYLRFNQISTVATNSKAPLLMSSVLTTQVPTNLSETGMLSEVENADKTQNVGKPIADSYDLNAIDTAQLLRIKGVGVVSAMRIADYKKKLGGFYSLSQLDEVKGLYPETLDRLKSMLTVDSYKIIGINANKASLEKLRAHPYISFWQAKVVVDLRKARGSIKSINDLVPFKEFKPEDLERLKWYLSF